MTRSDVDTVIQTLAGHNAYTISDNIEGDDKFGKLLSFNDLCHKIAAECRSKTLGN